MKGEYDFVVGQLFQMEDSEKYMLEMADMYLNNEKMIAAIDSQYGKGSSVFIGEAIREFYKAHCPQE